MAAETPLLDKKFLERLERLTIHWQRSFSGLVGGHNMSNFAGSGQEFLDHRNYYQGDDLRAVNWRAYMRLDKMVLKMFQIEPRVPVRLLLDISTSMTAGEGDLSKFRYAKRLAAALCYVGLVRLDTIEIQPFSTKLHQNSRSGGGRHRITPVMNFIDALEPTGTTDFLAVSKAFLNEYPQRGLVIVISDFLDDAGAERALKYIADYGNELLLIQIWTEEDRNPPWRGEVEFVDAESGERLRIHVDENARRKYTAGFDRFSAAIRQVALRADGRYAGLPTSTAIEDAIFGPLVQIRSIA